MKTLLAMLLVSSVISRRSRVREEPLVVAPPDVAGGPPPMSVEVPAEAAAEKSVQTMKVDMSRSPNATVAQMFMSKTLGAQWAQMPIGIPLRHDPLLSLGVVQEPTLLKIDEMNDAGGALGSTYIVRGLGPFVMFKGTWKSRHFGYNRIRATVNGAEAFQLANSKHSWNPAKMRYSYRVLAPKLAQKSYDVKFTINRDLFGRGFFGIKDEYRIYKGRERNGHMVYYCVGSWRGWKIRCWHSKREYESGRSSATITGIPGPKIGPCAVLAQVPNLGAFVPGAPDQYYLFVHAGEDSALLLAFSILYDSTEDQKDADNDQPESEDW